MTIYPCLLFWLLLMSILLFSDQTATLEEIETSSTINHARGIIGAVLDYGSRIGKEQKIAMEMAIDDFYKRTNQLLTLQIENSKGKPLNAALAGRHLIEENHVLAILGPRTWEETTLVAEVGTQSQIPVLSFTDLATSWSAKKWPFLIHASPSQHKQLKAIADIIRSWRWRHVIVIYEDALEIFPYLHEALKDAGVQISRFIAISSAANSSIFKGELKRLKGEQCRVFLVHTSLPLAISLYEEAKNMDMMEEGYVWINTNTITSLVHSFSSSTISSMQGVIGVKGYVNDKGHRFQDFYKRFLNKFRLYHPEESNYEPSLVSVQTYDATWAVALALQEGKSGQKLLEKILLTNFNGISGKFQFVGQELRPMNVFRVISVVGKSYNELGFWSDGLGFSKNTEAGKAIYNVSMKVLGQVVWPGGPLFTPVGWAVPTDTKPLKIGVPKGDPTNRYVEVIYHQSTHNYSFEGFSVQVFKAAVRLLQYPFSYQFIPFDGCYDDLVNQIHLKVFDAVVGDVAILASRYEHAEFTQPHAEPGLVMIVPDHSGSSNQTWLFIKPFTKSMWLLLLFATLYKGFVVWNIERHYNPELRGCTLTNQIGTVLWLSFTASSSQGERPHSTLSGMATLPWFIVVGIITQCYSASLSSMLTVQRFVPDISDIETLKTSNAMIGYTAKSFMANYLVDVLQFNNRNIKSYSTIEDYARALRSGEVAAVFLEVPVAKLFLAKYCNGFMIAGPTYSVGGYGYAFPRGSPMVPDIDEAIFKLSESGTMRNLENIMIGSETCENEATDLEDNSLSLTNFWVLLVFTVGMSTAALVVYHVRNRINILGMSTSEYTRVWIIIFIVLKYWHHQQIPFSARRTDREENPTKSPNIPESSAVNA